MSNQSSRAPSGRTGEKSPARFSNPGKCGNEESYDNLYASAGEGSHGICGMPGGLTGRHDGGSPVKGDLRQSPGVAWRGGTCWWDVSWQWLPARNHPPRRHTLHKDGMEVSHPQSGAPPGTGSIPSQEKVQFVVEDAWPFRERASGYYGRLNQ